MQLGTAKVIHMVDWAMPVHIILTISVCEQLATILVIQHYHCCAQLAAKPSFSKMGQHILAKYYGYKKLISFSLHPLASNTG
jgi:hypothetical protein